jgi:hypothetical protein
LIPEVWILLNEDISNICYLFMLNEKLLDKSILFRTPFNSAWIIRKIIRIFKVLDIFRYFLFDYIYVNTWQIIFKYFSSYFFLTPSLLHIWIIIFCFTWVVVIIFLYFSLSIIQLYISIILLDIDFNFISFLLFFQLSNETGIHIDNMLFWYFLHTQLISFFNYRVPCL